MENAKEIVPIIDPFQALNTWKEAVTNHFNCNHREFSATKSSGALGTSMAALGLVIAWVDSHFLTDRLTVNHEQELREKNCF